MKLELFFGLLIGKVINWGLKLTGRRGTALPGLIVENIFPNFLAQARSSFNQVIAITGTNGKTSAQTLLAHTLSASGNKVIVNGRGSNLSRGLVSQLIKDLALSGNESSEKVIGVFEVEEATLPRIATVLNPDILIVTNFYRDQLDAYGEIERTKKHVAEAISLLPNLKLIANGDDPQVLELLAQTNRSALQVKITGSEKFLNYEPGTAISHNASNYAGEIIEFPAAKITTKLTPEFTWRGVKFNLNLPGFYSYYSFAFVFAALQILGSELTGDLNKLAGIIANCPAAFGRGEVLRLGQNDLQFFLVKNPVGFDLGLDLLSGAPDSLNLIILINDNIADGRDVSWLWDSQLEKLNHLKISRVLLAGTRSLDMQLRLKYAWDSAKKAPRVDLASTWKDVANKVGENSQSWYVIATYTAMNQFRDFLLTNGAVSLSTTPNVTATSAK